MLGEVTADGLVGTALWAGELNTVFLRLPTLEVYTIDWGEKSKYIYLLRE